MIQEAIEKLSKGNNLSADLMQAVMEEIMTGKVDTEHLVSFLTLLERKGESVEELTAAVKIMRQHASKINTKHEVILDTCGTGGDRKGTFNISTAVAFVVSGAGIAVAKHGNRSVSSRCGSADILESLDININMDSKRLGECLDDIGITFLFAQNLHPAMKYAMPARKQIGKKTMFNILGPLSNPAGATHQLVGVYDSRWVEVLAQVLKNLGSVHALVVHGEDGLDEITTTAKTIISEAQGREIDNFSISPEDFGFNLAKPEDLNGGIASLNAEILIDILKGKPGPRRDVVLLNAGAAIYTAEKVKSIKEGVALARESIDSNKAMEKLQALRKYSHK